MKKYLKLLSLIGVSLLLTGCNRNNIEDPDTPNNPSDPEEPITPSERDFKTYQDIDEYMSTSGLTPSKGNVNILVVPVEFSDLSEFDNETLNMIDDTFNSTNSTYFESVKSYYQISSYNKLNFNFTLCDPYTSIISSTNFKRLETNGINGTTRILNDMYNKLTINRESVNYLNYDSDLDGYVDGVWLIYNNANANEVFNQSNYWAYTSYLDVSPDLTNPVFNTFANCSKFFLYEGNSSGYDAHTLIHETGHMLGLEDYYSYDNYYSASGGLMMMDLNIGDHDSFSKFSLGWIDPIVINKECEVTLKPLTTEGKAIIIPSESYYGNAFGEYLIIEFYSPTKLNELDSNVIYNQARLYSDLGIIVYHVDARLGLVKSPLNYSYIDNSETYDYSNISNYSYISLLSSNTPSYRYNNSYNLIEIVTKNNINMFDTGFSNNTSLFKLKDSFNSDNYTSFFNNSKFNDGSEIEFNFEVSDLNNESVTLKFTKRV